MSAFWSSSPVTDIRQAFGTLKSLGGTLEVARVLGTALNLRSLLKLSYKIDDSLQNEALRCIANTVLLDESARVTFVGPEVDGGSVCVGLLQVSPLPIFILLLFMLLYRNLL